MNDPELEEFRDVVAELARHRLAPPSPDLGQRALAAALGPSSSTAHSTAPMIEQRIPQGVPVDLPHLAPDDPIAHVMTVKREADGTITTGFGPYDILGEVARGGMGIVYRARQRSLKRIVALKVMKEGENASERQVRRFKRETEAAAKLQHPNIVAVHEVGCHEGFHYFTMDLIEGDPLDAVVKRGDRLPVDRVLQLVLEVAQAVHYAHGKGIVHRDLKPANVLLDSDGHPKVTDFGLAKQIDHKSLLTRTGAVVGTPFYMPPEQARGDVDLDQRADVYALGVILYELLTLKLPFHGETTMEVYHKILEDEALPPRKHDPRIDKDLDTLVLKAMDKEPARRYQTAQELAEDLQRYLNGEPILARPLGPAGRILRLARRNPRRTTGAAGVAAMLLGGVGLAAWIHHDKTQAELAALRDQEWTTFLSQVEGQLVNARTQIGASQRKSADGDVTGAVEELRRALRYLDDLPLLAEEHQKHNPPERGAEHLASSKASLDAIYQDAWLELGRAQMKLDPEQALASLRSGLARSPDAPPLLRELGRAQTALGELDAARATFEGLLAKDEADVDARTELGRVHARAGRSSEALACCDRVISGRDGPVEKGQLVRAHLLRGQVRHRLGLLEEARKDLDRANAIESSFEGWVSRGRVHLALGHLGEALEDAKEAVDLEPGHADGYVLRAEVLLAQEKVGEAIKDFDVALARSPQAWRGWLGLGRAQERAHEDAKARAAWERLVTAKERGVEPFVPQALVALAELDRVDADPVLCLLETEERLRSANGGAVPALAPLLAARDARRRELLGSARARCDQALQLSPDSTAALIARARLALDQGDPAAAARDLAACEAALDRRGVATPSAREAPQPAVEDFDDWSDPIPAKSEPKRPRCHPDLLLQRALSGVAALAREDLPGARKGFEAALQLDPECALARAGLGHVLLREGKEAEATVELARAQARASEGDDEVARWYHEGLRQVQHASRSRKAESLRRAARCHARALRLHPYHGLAATAWSRACAGAGQYDAAVLLAERAVEADPRSWATQAGAGLLHTVELPVERAAGSDRPATLRDPARGLVAWEAAIALANGPLETAQAAFGRAQARRALGGDLAAVRADVERATNTILADLEAAEPHELTQARTWLAFLVEVCEQQGDAEGAARARARVEEVRLGTEQAVKRELEEGRLRRDRLDYSGATARFERALELDPECSEAYYERGSCYLKLGNFVPGVLDFSRALELDPRIADQVHNKVHQLVYVVDLNRVIGELDKIVADHPEEAHVVFLRGFFHVAKAELKRAERPDLERGIADFDRCLELNPRHVTALIYRGYLRTRLADQLQEPEREAAFLKALEDYPEARKHDPGSSLAAYMEALTWTRRSDGLGLAEPLREAHRAQAIAALRAAAKAGFTGWERLKTERGFDPIRQTPEFLELMRGK